MGKWDDDEHNRFSMSAGFARRDEEFRGWPVSPVISERTAKEWPEDHPLRKISSVLPDEYLATADAVICSIIGEPRIPPASGDSDVETLCSRCNVGIVHRASAPPIPKICWQCSQRAAGGDSPTPIKGQPQ